MAYNRISIKPYIKSLAYMNMFARFDENPAMTLQDIKKTKRNGRTDARTHGQRENSIPTTNKVCGGYNYACVLFVICLYLYSLSLCLSVK